MNNLRLILFGIGIVIIASIYFWDIFKQQRSRKREFVSGSEDRKFPELHIKPATEPDDNYSEELSDLNELMAYNREFHVDEEDIRGTSRGQASSQNDTSTTDSNGKQAVADPPVREPIVVFYITAPDTMHFTGTEILQAAEMVGMVHGAMDIFHHFGPGHKNYEQPLFSMANIFEPGYFKFEDMDSFTTRGIVLFMYQADKSDAGLSTELLINTIIQLADILGGEIRGKDQKLINESVLNGMRDQVRKVSG